MNTEHQIAMLVSNDLDDEKCREHVIEHMLSIFPDAIVDGAPQISSSDESKMVRVIFTSPMFDHVADRMLHIVLNEFDMFKKFLNDSPGLTQESSWAYSYVIDALANRVKVVFGERE